MSLPFNKISATKTEATASLLRSWNVDYELRPDGSIYVDGNLDISAKNLTALPDLTCVSVGGNFECSENELTSLKGSPFVVHGSYYCTSNNLTSLEGAPDTVWASFNCSFNNLKTLVGAPRYVAHSFICSHNKLTSLFGAPEKVGEGLHCKDNDLESLEYTPKGFDFLTSDFGEYRSWAEVPDAVKISTEAEARALKDFVRKSTILERDVATPKAIKFKPRRR